MTVPYRARIDERTLLNLPGFHSGAYMYVFVEDTSERGLQYGPYCRPGCRCGCVENFEPRTSLWIADCDNVVNLAFDVDSEGYRENSLHKLDTLIAGLRVFRAALVEEFEPYDERARALVDLQEQLEEDVQDEQQSGQPRVAPTPRHRGREARHASAKRVHGSSNLPGVFPPTCGSSYPTCRVPRSRSPVSTSHSRHGVVTHP